MDLTGIKPTALNTFTSGKTFSNSSTSPPSTNITDSTKKKTRRGGKRNNIKNHVDNASDMSSTSISSSPVANRVPMFSPFLPVKTTNNKANLQHNMKESFTFAIKRVEEPKSGRFIRNKSSKHKHINLKTFLNPGTSLSPCIFTSITKLEDEVKNVSLSAAQTQSKIKSRKYPKEEIRIRKKRDRSSKESDTLPFPIYISPEEANAGLESGIFNKGFVRINPKNYKEAFVGNEDTSKPDYCLTSVIDRNRALEGDEVILQLKSEAEWVEGKVTAKVIFIKQEVHSRIVVGCLRPSDKKNSDFALFYPRDKRCPLLRISQAFWPNGFKSKPNLYADVLFVAKISIWTVPSYASGILIENLGLSGDLKVETISILREFCLDVTPFSDDIKQELPQSQEIPMREFEYREDIRKHCVFTIDPETARDLDDAVSAKVMPNGNFEVGVHISDASFYVEEGTELDQIVSRKATTVYLVDNVYHMLPVDLCLFCSLLPGEDKLAFSVFWEITLDAEIVSTRFTRTIMNSCVKLAYEHAQMVIDQPDKKFTKEDFPNIHNNFGPAAIASTVKILQNIATKLHQKRIEDGLLKIDQTKLLFNLDPVLGEPLDFFKYENKEANRLIEEFMLLANISVAERINEFFPQLAFLRCHEPPKQTMLVELQNNLATCGIHIDISSSGGISNSLKKYITDDYAGFCRAIVLNHLTAKAMTRARYFCAASAERESNFNHYALSIPIYTHFTSPIRRYADIMVHRLLASSLGYQEPPQWDETYVSAIAKNCNKQKYNAKRAGEASIELYLSHYITKHQPFVQDCVVVDVKEKSFDAIVLRTGSTVRIYSNNCASGSSWETESIPTDQQDNKSRGKKQTRVTITFPRTKQYPKSTIIVEIFSLVMIKLERKNVYKLEGTLMRPRPTQIFTRST